MLIDNIALLTNYLTSYIFFFLAAAIILSLLYLRGYRKFVRVSFLTIAVTSITVTILKILIAVPRPVEALVELSSYAFPSGHAAMSASVSCLLIWILFEKQKNVFYRTLFTAGIVLIAGWITYTRLILTVHTLDQILVGTVIGILVFFGVLAIESKIFEK